MSKSIFISFVFLFFSSILFAQKNINSYKYILVPKQYEFQKSVDQHQLNSLTKFLFNKAGYTVLFTDDNYPEDLAKNSCLALKVRVNSNPSFLKTKMNIDLYDCYNKVVYSTKEAVSKEKVYKKAYQEAIRKTFVELAEHEYNYNGEAIVVEKPKQLKTKVAAVIKTPKVKKPIKVKEVVTKPVVLKVTPKVVKKEIKVEVKTNIVKTVEKTIVKTIEGNFNFDNWGQSTISEKGANYTVTGGDENFEFAIIYPTSKPTIFIIKWVAFKQPQLLEVNSEGNLVVETNGIVKIYKRAD